MTSDAKRVFSIVAVIILIAGALTAFLERRNSIDTPEALERFGNKLRSQGVKVELAEFAYTNDVAGRTRADALLALTNRLGFESRENTWDLLPTTADQTGVILWKQDRLALGNETMSWEDARRLLAENDTVLAAGQKAAAEGPVRFDINPTNPITPRIQGWSRAQTFFVASSLQLMTELRDGQSDAAWTNLFIATTLVRNLQPGPARVTYLLRLKFAHAAFDDTWQFLQSHGGTDRQLGLLQKQWESFEPLESLDEPVNLDLAYEFAACRRLAGRSAWRGFSLRTWWPDFPHHPRAALAGLQNRIMEARTGKAALGKETDKLRFYFDWLVELRGANQFSSWAKIRDSQEPSGFLSLASADTNIQSALSSPVLSEASLLTIAAEAEARRRVLVTALAIERYHRKHGMYPATLAGLVPEFLDSVPADFMDGQPLRYSLTGDGHFIVYSVGLDGVDDGGKIPAPWQPSIHWDFRGSIEVSDKGDIVWPAADRNLPVDLNPAR